MALKLKLNNTVVSVNEAKSDDESTVADLNIEAKDGDFAGRTIEQILDLCAGRARAFYRNLDFAKSDDPEKQRYLTGVNKLTDDEKLAKAKSTNSFNPLFVGPTGAGKTTRVHKWAIKNNYEVITLNMMGDALDFLGVKTINKDYELPIDDEGNTKKTSRVSTVATQAFDKFLTGKKKVLFLDEINKTQNAILQALFDLISFHTVQNGDEVMYLSRLLFVVGAMNPSDYGSDRNQLDPALKARMNIIFVGYDLDPWAKAEIDNYSADVKLLRAQLMYAKDHDMDPDDIADLEKDYAVACGRLDLVNKLVEKKDKIKWTDGASISDADELDGILVFRTIEGALDLCDGTKNDFISIARSKCGVAGAASLSGILTDYKDKEHKANEIWGKDYTPKPKEMTAEEKIRAEMTDEEKQNGGLTSSLLDQLKRKRNQN